MPLRFLDRGFNVYRRWFLRSQPVLGGVALEVLLLVYVAWLFPNDSFITLQTPHPDRYHGRFHSPYDPPHVLQPGVKKAEIKADEILDGWLSRFSDRVQNGAPDNLSDLFLDDCWWRDMVALNWDFSSKNGINNLIKYLATATNPITNINPIHTGGFKATLVDLGGLIWIQGGFTFSNGHGTGRGVVKLINTAPNDWKCWIIFTHLDELDFQKELEAKRILSPGAANQQPAQQNGDAGHSSTSRDDPQVLIIGAGQGGLSLGARLSHMGIRTLLVDKHARLGDSWRSRYKSVTLHTPTYTDHPPFMKIPTNWPRWLPGYKVADLWEHYGQLMGLDCLLSSEVISARYHESERRYTVHVRSGDSTTVFKPRHVVMATGILSEIPNRPQFPGEEEFQGQVYHSSDHRSAEDITDLGNKKIAIIGAATTAHDIAQDFVQYGAAQVSLTQRHPIFFLTAKSCEMIQLKLWDMEGITTEEADLFGNSIPPAVVRAMGPEISQTMAEVDKTMIEGLRSAGVAIRTGHDGYGLPDHQLIHSGRFYLDQGAGQMIVDGRIKVHQCEDGVRNFYKDGLTLADGTNVEADIVDLATSNQSSRLTIERVMGKEVSNKMRPEFPALDAENERAGVWRPTGQPGFWYMTGSFMWCRQYSLPLALQIAAIEKGLNKEHYNM